MKITYYLAIIGFVAVGAYLGDMFFKWMDRHDAAFQAAVERYEACVQTEYGRAPVEFAQEHGYYPDCD